MENLQKVPPNDQPLRLAVPTSNKFDVMKRFHNNIFGGHRGVKTTYEKIKERYYWVNMYKEIENIVRHARNALQINYTLKSTDLYAQLSAIMPPKK